MKRAMAIVPLVLAAALLPASGAHAATPGVGVDGCNTVGGPDYVPGQCRAVVTGGYYYLSVSSTGWAQAEVGCTPSGGGGPVDNGGSGSAYTYFYLPAGICTVFVYGEVSASGSLTKF